MAKPIIIIQVNNRTTEAEINQLKQDLINTTGGEYHCVVLLASFVESITISNVVNADIKDVGIG